MPYGQCSFEELSSFERELISYTTVKPLTCRGDCPRNRAAGFPSDPRSQLQHFRTGSKKIDDDGAQVVIPRNGFGLTT
ncbi:MAG: hypothetical protein AAF368_07170, partial [Planctomycetota bacterium]